MESVATKRCSGCKEVKPVSEFHRRARSKDGLQTNCKMCALIAQQAWLHRLGSDAWNQYQRDWQAAHPGQGAAAARRHYWAHQPEQIARVLKWRAANRDRLREADSLWRKVNRKNAEYQRRRKARLRGNLRIPFTPAQLAAKLAYWGNRCWICGGDPTAVDHVKPLAKGGPHCLANLRPICNSCNSRKRSKWPFPLAH